MGQAAGSCRGREAAEEELVYGRYSCQQNCCSEASVSRAGGLHGHKQVMLGVGDTDEDAPTDEAELNPNAGGLSGMACGMAPTTSNSSASTWEPVSISEYELTVGDLMDTLSICSRSLDVLRAALEVLERSHGAQLHASFLRAVASVAVSGTPCSVEAALPHVAENLLVVQRSGDIDASLLRYLRKAVAQMETWTFDGTGRVDVAPRLSDPELLRVRLSQETVATIRRVACPHVPAEKHNWQLLRPLRERQFDSSRTSDRPHVVITVGPPGAGKTHMLVNSCIDFLRKQVDVPPKDDFVRLDPDYYISNILDNNNEHREMANFLMHESFTSAIGQRRHVLFDHTGKDLRNTCGRVISRFKEANYTIHLCIVLSSYESCRSRTETRGELTGRPVADSYTRSVFEALRTTIPWYLENHKSIADTTVLFTNNVGSAITTHVIGDDDSVLNAVKLSKELLVLPPALTCPPARDAARQSLI